MATPSPLCKLEEVKRWVKIGPTESSQDELLEGLIEACSELIAEYCGRDNLGAVVSYNENYRIPSNNFPRTSANNPRIVLRHYPIVGSPTVTWNNTTLTILTSQQVQSQQGGVFVEDDLRTLSFLGLWMPPNYGYLNVAYQAGYTIDPVTTPPIPQTIPKGLRQVCIQFVGEVYKSKDWIGFTSKSLQGEVTSFEGGRQFGMSARTVAMLQPYRDRVTPII